MSAIDNLGKAFDGAPQIGSFHLWELDENIPLEVKSIRSLDIFGKELPHTSRDINPFTEFLKEESNDIENNIIDSIVNYNDPNTTPSFALCKGSLEEMFGSENDVIRDVLDGSVQLHDMPEELLETGSSSERAQWVRENRPKPNPEILAKFLSIAGLNPDDLTS